MFTNTMNPWSNIHTTCDLLVEPVRQRAAVVPRGFLDLMVSKKDDVHEKNMELLSKERELVSKERELLSKERELINRERDLMSNERSKLVTSSIDEVMNTIDDIMNAYDSKLFDSLRSTHVKRSDADTNDAVDQVIASLTL